MHLFNSSSLFYYIPSRGLLFVWSSTQFNKYMLFTFVSVLPCNFLKCFCKLILLKLFRYLQFQTFGRSLNTRYFTLVFRRTFMHLLSRIKLFSDFFTNLYLFQWLELEIELCSYLAEHFIEYRSFGVHTMNSYVLICICSSLVFRVITETRFCFWFEHWKVLCFVFTLCY